MGERASQRASAPASCVMRNGQARKNLNENATRSALNLLRVNQSPYPLRNSQNCFTNKPAVAISVVGRARVSTQEIATKEEEMFQVIVECV